MKHVLTFALFTALVACGDNNPSMMHEPVCGDGIIEGAEACDDGNGIDGDQCSNTCAIPGCGDGVVNFNEACDDGNDVNGDGCDTNCQQSFCGNGIKGPDEECDDGNAVSGDGCDANCTTTMCGNGTMTVGEACDDGNAVEGDGCDSNCKVSACGNGVKGGNEGCDDGNTMTGDGCSATCGVETQEIEPNDDGTPSIGASGINGNDFATAAPDTNGSITQSTTIVAALMPAGDEDIFKLTNNQTVPQHIKIDTWNLDTGFGIGTSCGSSIDTGIQIKNAAGAVLASNNDRNATTDKCAGLAIDLFPGDSVYIQVVENGDNAVIAKYALDVIVEPSICGDSHVGPGEDCDDSNTAAGDGCSPTCQIENSVNEIEPNEDGTPSTGGSGTSGNDFGTANPLNNGMITGSITIVGALTPTGDEDIYAFTNIRPNIVTVSFDVWGLIQGLGLNVPCGETIDTGMHIRDASGTSLVSNDDRNGASDRCSTLAPFTLLPGQTRFVHVSEFGDDKAVQKYALVIKYKDILCGDNSVGPGEQCDDGNTMNGDGCDSTCQLEPFCGDAILQSAEQCDDGNMNAGDGCSATCQVEGAVTEIEPNEDGSISTGGGTTGNDFATANADANGVFTGSVRIAARLRPAGDEDVFAFKNPSTTTAVAAAFNIWNNAPGFGVGVSCGSSVAVDSFLHIRNAAGVSLASNDDRVSSSDRCAALTFGILPGQTVYAHVLHDGDNAEEPSYTLDVVYTPVPCGDAVTGPGEQCDDGNTNNGDGCSSSCQLENTMNEIEPNEDGTPSTGGSGIVGNDFAVANANANGAITSSKRIFGNISPAGDEDVFAITNSNAGVAFLKLDVWSMASGKGLGIPCGTVLDTGMQLRDAAGVALIPGNDDRNGSSDRCSTLPTFTLAPGQTVYAHLMAFGDGTVYSNYLLDVQITPVVCGDGVIGQGEQCDDGNTTSGDGCNATCQLEIVCGNGVLQAGEACDDSNTTSGDGCSSTCTIENQVNEVEPNNTTADAMNNALQITGNVVVAGAITPSGDVDRFRVDVATATVVRFESFVGWGDCSAATIDLRLFDSAGNTITTDLEGTGIKECGAITKFLAAGTYYVQVEERGNNGTIAAYQLQVAFQTDGGSETEPNDTTAQASVNLLNERFVLGDHTNVMDADVYAITVPPKAHIRAEIVEGSTAETCESGGIDARISLFDDTGALIAEDNDSGRGLCSLIDGTGSSPLDPTARNASTTTKTYYLMVRSSAFATTTNAMFAYRLQLTLR